MAKSKGSRIVVTLECTACRENNSGVNRYTTSKNRKNTTERLELSKYCPNCKTHTLHKEIK